jgi:cell shape-determining protein MreC
VDKGFQQGVKAGLAVVDDNGVVGHDPGVSLGVEVTLVTDGQAVPIRRYAAACAA